MFCCFQLHDQNVPLILNARSNLHAFKRSAKIPVLQPRVVSMPNAVPTITELCVFVKPAMLGILIQFVKSVSIFLYLFVSFLVS